MTKQEREIIFGKFGGRCAYCGCQLEKGWHADHVEPVRRFEHRDYNWQTGKFEGVTKGMAKPHLDNIENMMPACPSCNINKHSQTVEQFRVSINVYLQSLNKRMVQYKMAKKYGLVVETGNPVIFYFETFKPDA